MSHRLRVLYAVTLTLAACAGESVGFHVSVEIRGLAEAFQGRIFEVDGQRLPAPSAFGRAGAHTEFTWCSRDRAGLLDRPLRVRILEGDAVRSELVIAARPCLGQPAGWREGLQERIALVLHPDGTLVAPAAPPGDSPGPSGDRERVAPADLGVAGSVEAERRRGYSPSARCEGPIQPGAKCGPRPCRARGEAPGPAPASPCG